MPPYRVGLLRRFGLKMGIYFAYFGLESRMVFEGTTGAYKRIYRFSSNEYNNEVEICEFEMHQKNFFSLRTLNLSNDDVIFALRSGLKTGMDFGVLV